MRKYELAVICPPSTSKSQQDGVLLEIKKEVEAIGGKIGKEDVWGKKELSYPIKKNSEGLFILFPFEAPPDKIKELEAKLRLKESILRHLLLVA